MNYEQKHKEALERARVYHTGGSTIDAHITEVIFPELKKSGDEKVRKALVELVKCNERSGYTLLNNVSTTSILAWLEKQQPFDKDKVAKEFLRGVAISIMNWLDANIPEDKMCLSNMECEDIENAVRNADWNKIYAYMKKKLEKQGEQKENIVEFKASDWYVSKVDGKIHNIYQSVDKVEPKFKVCDWITDGYIHCKITEVLDDRYIIEYKFSKRSAILFENEDHYHLWTIDDAKEGDVIVSGRTIVIVKHKHNNTSSFDSACAYIGEDDSFISCTQYCYRTDGSSWHPATKEQRDLLFQKMKDAGYEWDAEKEELKKIEPKMLDADKAIKL